MKKSASSSKRHAADPKQKRPAIMKRTPTPGKKASPHARRPASRHGRVTTYVGLVTLPRHPKGPLHFKGFSSVSVWRELPETESAASGDTSPRERHEVSWRFHPSTCRLAPSTFSADHLRSRSPRPRRIPADLAGLLRTIYRIMARGKTRSGSGAGTAASGAGGIC